MSVSPDTGATTYDSEVGTVHKATPASPCSDKTDHQADQEYKLLQQKMGHLQHGIAQIQAVLESKDNHRSARYRKRHRTHRNEATHSRQRTPNVKRFRRRSSSTSNTTKPESNDMHDTVHQSGDERRSMSTTDSTKQTGTVKKRRHDSAIANTHTKPHHEASQRTKQLRHPPPFHTHPNSKQDIQTTRQIPSNGRLHRKHKL